MKLKIEQGPQDSHDKSMITDSAMKGDKILVVRTFIALAVAAMLLLGGYWFLSRGDADDSFVGKVNGEGITRKELTARVDQIKKFHEKQNGQELFKGREGDEVSTRMRDKILDEIILEKIVSQEARKAGFVKAPENEVAKQFEEMKAKSGLTESEIEEQLGVKLEDLKSEISDQWAISQFIEKEVLKDNPEDRDTFLQAWLSNAMRQAKVEKFEKPKLLSTAKASCCAPGGGCGPGQARAPRAEIEKDAKEKGLEYYEKKTQRKGAEAKVIDFGCHIQVDIMESGKVVLSLTYSQGMVEET